MVEDGGLGWLERAGTDSISLPDLALKGSQALELISLTSAYPRLAASSLWTPFSRLYQ